MLCTQVAKVPGNIDENGTAVGTFGKYADDGTIAYYHRLY
jgi:hypothetical protein